MVPSALNKMLVTAEAEMRDIRDAAKPDTEAVARARAHVVPVPTAAASVADRAAFDVLASGAAGLDQAERAHQAAGDALVRARTLLAEAQQEEARFSVMLAKAKRWRLALVAVLVLLVLWLLW